MYNHKNPFQVAIRKIQDPESYHVRISITNYINLVDRQVKLHTRIVLKWPFLLPLYHYSNRLIDTCIIDINKYSISVNLLLTLLITSLITDNISFIFLTTIFKPGANQVHASKGRCTPNFLKLLLSRKLVCLCVCACMCLFICP